MSQNTTTLHLSLQVFTCQLILSLPPLPAGTGSSTSWVAMAERTDALAKEHRCYLLQPESLVEITAQTGQF